MGLKPDPEIRREPRDSVKDPAPRAEVQFLRYVIMELLHLGLPEGHLFRHREAIGLHLRLHVGESDIAAGQELDLLPFGLKTGCVSQDTLLFRGTRIAPFHHRDDQRPSGMFATTSKFPSKVNRLVIPE